MMILNQSVNAAAHHELFSFTHGIDLDSALFRQEIQVQMAWLAALTAKKHITSEEHTNIRSALTEAEQLMAEGRFEWRIEDEDIHMNLERFVTERCGEAGKKMHIGRSRNDLIATTLRLHAAEALAESSQWVLKLQEAICDRAERWLEVIVPGLTHLQAGQPVRLGHAFSAHAWALSRDQRRLQAARSTCLEACPMGAAAFAGTHINIDVKAVSAELGFLHPLQHSYDAVSDRDFMLEGLAAWSLLAVHLSRICNEIMFWSSSAAEILKLSKDYSTGSSIMPNKRNPDVFELVRARSARMMAQAHEGASIVKQVVPSYGTDLHELKRTFLSAHREVMQCLRILPPAVSSLEASTAAAQALLQKGHVLATEIANALSASGTPFREAYRQSAEMVAEAERAGVQVETIAERHTGQQFTAEGAVECRASIGGTSLATARMAIPFPNRFS